MHFLTTTHQFISYFDREPLSLTVVLFFVGQLLELSSSQNQAHITTAYSKESQDVEEFFLALEGNKAHNRRLGFPPGNGAAADRATLASYESRYFLDFHEIVVLPFVNPDGYVRIQETGNKALRKNQRHTCPQQPLVLRAQGVDLNRNYDYAFGSARSP